MKWFTMDHVKNLMAVAALISLGYGMVAKAGWVISRAEAKTIVELAVQQATAQTNSALLDEAKARQLADLNFQVELVSQDISALLSNPNRTEADNFQLEQLKKRLDQLNSQIAGLQQ